MTDTAALPEGHFVALEGARYVGVCSLRRETDDTLRIGLTGVLPAYRRRGIGRLLKLRAHAWARAHGFREIHTTTTNTNAASAGQGKARYRSLEEAVRLTDAAFVRDGIGHGIGKNRCV